MSQLSELINLEHINYEDPLIKELLVVDTSKKFYDIFHLSNFRSVFAKKELFKLNDIQFVFPKYIRGDVHYGRSQLISGYGTPTVESLVSSLSKQVLYNYIGIYQIAHQINENVNLFSMDEVFDYANRHQISAILDFQKDKDLNKLVLNFFSLTFTYGDYRILQNHMEENIFKEHFYKIYRGNNKIVPTFIHNSNKSQLLKRIVQDYTICSIINIFVLYKKIKKFASNNYGF